MRVPQAFPESLDSNGPFGGTTLRDYFAAQIAAGMAAYSGTSGVSYRPYEIAGRAYEVADAMLSRREAA